VPEFNEDSPEQRIEEDTTVLAAIFHEIGADDVKLESVVRLGKRSDDPARPRPIKIILDSVEGKVKLLRNAKKLAVEKGERLGEGVYSPRLDTQAEGGQKASSRRVKTTKGQRREKDLIIFNKKKSYREGDQQGLISVSILEC